MQLLPWVKVHGIVATAAKTLGDFRKFAALGDVTVGTDKDGQGPWSDEQPDCSLQDTSAVLWAWQPVTAASTTTRSAGEIIERKQTIEGPPCPPAPTPFGSHFASMC